MGDLQTTMALSLIDAEPDVRQALAGEGFGVLTEIDVASTLRQKLGVERTPLKILGACKPELANRALSIEPSAALVLPCNVVLDEPEPGRTTVTIADPHQMMPSAALTELAEEAGAALNRVVDRLRS